MRASLEFRRRFRGVLVESGFIAGHTAFHGCFPAFVFFLQPLRPFASEPSSPFSPPYTGSFLTHQEMASLVHPRRFQTEGELNTVRRLLGWSAQETGWWRSTS